jgi:hypothetical protein
LFLTADAKDFGFKWSPMEEDVAIQTEADAQSDPICSTAGCTQYEHKKKKRGYKINYFVPNFGPDSEILDSHASLATSEDALSHKLIMGTAASKAKWANPAKEVDYNFAPKLDADVRTTQKNMGDAEMSLGHKWALADFVQTGLESGAETHLESDPICDSSGCNQYKHKKKERGYKINYFVPNFGADRDINDDFESLKKAEEIVGHEFQIGTAASKAKWKNPAKDVDYNFAPQLDPDVVSTQKNLADAQTALGHKWVIA